MRTKRENQRRRRLFIQQRLMGLGLIIISVIVVLMASKGVTVEDRDCTCLLFTVPVGLTLLFSKKLIIE